jgi:CDP-glucose 4,6-dehydratase
MAKQSSTLENLVEMDLNAIYRGRKVFVTGHTGFKGAWLISWLYQLGAKVKGFALNAVNEHDLYNIIKGNELCQSVIADIRDKEKLKEEILSFEPDFIFHLAAQPLVRLSYELSLETFEINAQGTANLLDALKFLNKPCVAVFITTDKVYDNLEIDYCYKEEDRLGGYDPYSASKACAELIIDSYRNSFFHPERRRIHQKSISSVRAGNVIGGGDWAQDRIIPDIIRSFITNKPVPVRNPKSVRPWQHVLEPLHGYLILGASQYKEPKKFAQAYNFGPYQEDTLTVETLVNQAIKEWGSGEYYVPQQDHSPHEAGMLKLDITKAIQSLDWKPKMNAAEAINKTITWYKETVIHKRDARTLTLQQINEFDSTI